MRSTTRRLTRLALVLGALLAGATPALAAAPANDTFATAKTVTLGFTETVNTSQATTDGDDAQLLETCPAPATDASVWYRIEGDGTRIAVDVRDSDYSAGVIVATGSQGNLSTVECAPGLVSFDAEVGTTYYVLVFDDQDDGGGNGGSLTIAFRPSTLPDLDFSVDAYGRVNARTGVVMISGAVTCTADAPLTIFVDASQRGGRARVLGTGVFESTCTGELQRWSVEIVGENGRFVGGNVLAQSSAFVCGEDECRSFDVEQTVKLSGRRK